MDKRNLSRMGMSTSEDKESLLSGYRVLDLTDEKGLLCGRTLGDWGADVIKVEAPGGDAARNIGPFIDDVAHPERSLFWLSTNMNKRSITLNLESQEGREIFKRLVKSADLMVESFDPGHMDRLQLGYRDLEKLNSGIIMTSITPFGQTGPYSRFKASDMVLWALGGMMYLNGDEDRPPVQLSLPQAYFQGGLHGAMGSMMALYHREMTGEGQHVDVSIQEAVDFTVLMADETYDILGKNLLRSGGFYASVRPEPMGTLKERVIWECKDGYVSAFFRGGALGVRASAKALTSWMREEKMAGELEGYDWDAYDFATMTQEERQRLERIAADFFLTKTKKELYERAARDGIILAPVTTVKDLAESEHLRGRQYWIEVNHRERGWTIPYPGAPIKTSAAPWRVYRRAPLLGEHNEKIYVEELGLNKEALCALKARGVI